MRNTAKRFAIAAMPIICAFGMMPAQAGYEDEPLAVDRGGVGDCLADLAACGWPLAGETVRRDAARHGPGPDRPYWRRNLFKRVGVDQKYLVARWWPSEIRNPAFAAPLGAAIVVAGSSREGARDLDDDTATWVGNEIRGTAGAAEVLSDLGDTDTAIVLVGSTYLVARLTHADRLAETTSLVAEALIDSGIWNTALKELTSRARPGETKSSRLLNDQSGSSGESFPSGHAMGAFAVAAVVSGQYREKKWVPWVAYGWASLTAASRVALGRHYVSDVVAGAALGQSIGRMVVARAHGELPARAQPWSPIVDPVTGGYGIAYSRSW